MQEPGPEHAAAFPFVDAVVREALRLYPPAHVTTRECTAAGGATLAGPGGAPIHIPQGTWWVGGWRPRRARRVGGMAGARARWPRVLWSGSLDACRAVSGASLLPPRRVHIPIWTLHHSEQHWEEPEAFRRGALLAARRAAAVQARPRLGARRAPPCAGGRRARRGRAARPAAPPRSLIRSLPAPWPAPSRLPPAAGPSGSSRPTRRRRRARARTCPSAWAPATASAISLRCRRCASRSCGEARAAQPGCNSAAGEGELPGQGVACPVAPVPACGQARAFWSCLCPAPIPDAASTSSTRLAWRRSRSGRCRCACELGAPAGRRGTWPACSAGQPPPGGSVLVCVTAFAAW